MQQAKGEDRAGHSPDQQAKLIQAVGQVRRYQRVSQQKGQTETQIEKFFFTFSAPSSVQKARANTV